MAKGKKKVSNIPLIILVLAGIIFGAGFIAYKNTSTPAPAKQYASPQYEQGNNEQITESPATPCKEYKDSKFNYSFTCPEGWFIKVNEIPEYDTTTLRNLVLNNSRFAENRDAKVRIFVLRESFEQAEMFLSYGDAGMLNKVDEKSTLTVSGKKAITATTTQAELLQNPEDVKKYGTDIIETGKSYTVLISLTEDTTITIWSELENKALVDQIVSTFKFTN